MFTMFIVRSGETVVSRRGQARMTMSGCQALEEWCRQVVAASGVSLANMSSAWSDGKVRWHLGAVKLCCSLSMSTQPTQHGILIRLLVMCSHYAISNYPHIHSPSVPNNNYDPCQAFCALIHSHRPDLIDWDTVKTNNAYQ